MPPRYTRGEFTDAAQACAPQCNPDTRRPHVWAHLQASSHDKAILKTHTRARSRLSLASLAPKVLAILKAHTRALSASASNLP